MKYLGFTLLAALMSPPLCAQSDFLTADEADQIRVAQEPNLRIGLYLNFAKQRADLLDQLFAENKVGRSSTIHVFLTQMTDLMETLDVVIDDALKRKKEVTALPDVAKAARDFQTRLQKHLDSNPPDLARYKFALETAIETLSDSAEMAEDDLRDRLRSVESKEVELRKQREAMTTPQSPEEAKKAAVKKSEDDSKAKKKPTLLKKGETLPSSGTGKQ